MQNLCLCEIENLSLFYFIFYRQMLILSLLVSVSKRDQTHDLSLLPFFLKRILVNIKHRLIGREILHEHGDMLIQKLYHASIS